MIKINPSLASADPLRLQEQIIELGDYPYLHLDIEDGNFVPNITFGMKTVHAVAGFTSKELDVHLMVTDPGSYIEELLDTGIRKIAFHIEAVSYPAVYLQKIRSKGGVAGVAFNCMEPVTSVFPYMDLLDYVLIMTSEPDGRGQEFNPYMLEKIRMARQSLPKRISVMADGGISEDRMKQVMEAGADTLVMGRAVWNAEDPGRKIAELLKSADQEGR